MTDCRAFVVAFRDVLHDQALVYQATCPRCGFESEPTLNDTVAHVQMTKHNNQQQGETNE